MTTLRHQIANDGSESWHCESCKSESAPEALACKTCGDTFSGQTQYRFAFKGKGGDLFLLYLLNAVKILITLGIYSAWAKAATYRFFFGNVEVAGSRLNFSGTGKEILRGVLIVAGVLIAANLGQFALIRVFDLLGMHWLNYAVGVPITLGMIYIWQLAVFSSFRYRCNRLSLRGIHFGLTGTAKDFAKEGFVRMTLGFVTLGILYPHYSHWKTQTLLRQMRFGDLAFDFDAPKGEYVRRLWKAALLMILTFGLYFAFFYPKWIAFKRNHTRLGHSRFNLEITTGGFIKVYSKMFLFNVFTLGFAGPWVFIMWIRFFIENTTLSGPTKIEDAVKGESPRGSGIGEALADKLDVDSGLDLGF